jgi:hypothetical protein
MVELLVFTGAEQVSLQPSGEAQRPVAIPAILLHAQILGPYYGRFVDRSQTAYHLARPE